MNAGLLDARPEVHVKLLVVFAIVLFGVLTALATGMSAVAGPDCDGGTPAINAAEAEMLDLINAYRADNGRDPLVLSDTLNRAAAWKAQHMAGNDYFSHVDDPSGRAMVDRVRDCGYTATYTVGEVIFAGQGNAEPALTWWQGSDQHRPLLLEVDFVAAGIGRAYSPDSEYGWYWVVNFGGVADGFTPPPPDLHGSGDVNCSGDTDSIDAALVLQLTAQLLDALTCADEGDLNGDGLVDSRDAALILQISAGLLDG